VKELF